MRATVRSFALLDRFGSKVQSHRLRHLTTPSLRLCRLTKVQSLRLCHLTKVQSLRLCRLMCGEALPRRDAAMNVGLRPSFGLCPSVSRPEAIRGAQPLSSSNDLRRGAASPHIGRQSRFKGFWGKAVLALLLLSFTVSAQTPQATPPPPAPPRSVTFPKPTEQTLPNGLRVIVYERRESPLVSAQILIKNGGEVDPPELAGLADLTANLLTKGTQSRDATKIAQEIESLGGSLDSGARWDASTATVGVMSDKISPAMEILADVVRRPTFKSEEVERLRQQYLDNVTLAMGEPGSIARFVGARVVFGDSPYGHPLSGTAESLTRITAADIVKMHGRFYRPDNAILVIGGDISGKDGFALATKYFGDWQKPTTPLPTISAAMKETTPKPGRIVVIDKPDAGQAAVYLARTGIARSYPDYYAGIVTNSVLSGYSGRLNQEIRIKRGLSYGAASTLDARRDVGPFVASAQTKNESGAEVAELLLGEISRLSSSPPALAELTPRKAVVIGNFSRNLETANGLVNQAATLVLHGLSLYEINRYIDNVLAIDTQAVQQFARTRLDPKTSNIIVVGNAKVFLPELQKKYPNVEVIPVSELDLNTALLRKKKQ